MSWARASHPMLCGGPCGGLIEKGDPVRWIARPGVSQRKKRCRDCAGEPVPDDLPDLPDVTTTRSIAQPNMFPMGTLAQDFRKRQSGDEE